MPEYQTAFKNRALACGFWPEIELQLQARRDTGEKRNVAIKHLMKLWWPKIHEREREMGEEAGSAALADILKVPKFKTNDVSADADWVYSELRSAANPKQHRPDTTPPSRTALHLWERCKKDEGFRTDWTKQYTARRMTKQVIEQENKKGNSSRAKGTQALLDTLLKELDAAPENLLQDSPEDDAGEHPVPAEAPGEGAGQPDVPGRPPGDVPA